MKKIILFLLTLTSLVSFSQKPLKINSTSYNDKGLIIDKNGELYSGEAIEPLKKGGVLKGKVNNGDITGTWKYLVKNELIGYHYYKDNGNSTYAFDAKKNLDWIETIDISTNTITEIKVDKLNKVEKLYIIDYKEDNSHENTFEFEKFTGNYYDITIADYDYNSLVVLDYFKNNKGEQELVLRDFEKHHELIKFFSKDNHISEILFLGDILEKPEDADYKLEKGFNASFTNLEDKDNFKLSLLEGKNSIFEILVTNGKIVSLDKVLNNKSTMLIYSEKEGYAPKDHEKANKLIEKANIEIKSLLK